MGARVLSARGSKMSILDKKFLCVTFLRTSDDVINYRGESGEPKTGSFLLNFSLNVTSKFRVPEMTSRGNSDTVKKISPRR